MATPNPLQTLSSRGFTVQSLSRLPLVRLYRTSEPDHALEELDSDRPEAVRVQRHGDSVVLEDRTAAESFVRATEYEDTPLDGLAALSPEKQTEALHGLTAMEPKAASDNLVRMAQNQTLPGDLAFQLAQLATQGEADVYIQRKPQLEGRIPDYEELKELTVRAGGLDIDFDYLREGCHARSHLLSELLEDEGINVSKLFVEGPLVVKNGARKVDGAEVTPEDVDWNFHTAPMVMVENEYGQIEPQVWDPSLAAHLEQEEAWFTPAEWCSNFYEQGDLKISVLDKSFFHTGQRVPESEEKTNQKARAMVEDCNDLSELEKYSAETVAPLIAEVEESN